MSLSYSSPETNRCLSFKYIFPTNNLQDSYPSSVTVYYEGNGVSKTNAFTLTKDHATASWVKKDISIPSISNLKVSRNFFFCFVFDYKSWEQV